MAIFVLKSPQVMLVAKDLSAYVRSVKINYGADIKETTASGAAAKTRLAGFIDWDMEIEFNQDFAATMVDATVFALVGAAPFAVKVRATSAAVGATNPSYEGNAVLESYNPISGNVGDLAVTTVRVRGTGALSQVT